MRVVEVRPVENPHRQRLRCSSRFTAEVVFASATRPFAADGEEVDNPTDPFGSAKGYGSSSASDERGGEMHAVVVSVTIDDEPAATEKLRSEIVPRISQAPGFVAGYWTRKGRRGPSDGHLRVGSARAAS